MAAKKKGDLFSESFSSDKKNSQKNDLIEGKNKEDVLSNTMFKAHNTGIIDNIRIDPELESLIPPLTQEELSNLESSLILEGCRDPLVVWNQTGGDEYILIDGHNRYRLCNKHGIEFKLKLKNFSSKAEVKDWMLSNQMSRRNLTPLQISYLRGLRYENEKLNIGRQKGSNDKIGQNVQFNKSTSESLSDEYGVNEKTIRRDSAFARGLDRLASGDSSIKWGILSGKIQAKKNTVTELVDKDDEFIEMVQARLLETESLERTIKLLLAEDGESGEESPVSEQPADLLEVKKRLSSLVNKVMKLEKEDPKRKEVIKDLKKLFKQFVDYLDK